MISAAIRIFDEDPHTDIILLIYWILDILLIRTHV